MYCCFKAYFYFRSIHEGTKEFAARCPECGKTFNDKGYLSSHMKIHRDKKEYACPHCPKRFNQRVAYNMHLRIHTGESSHKSAHVPPPHLFLLPSYLYCYYRMKTIITTHAGVRFFF